MSIFRKDVVIGILALGLIILSVLKLEAERAGLDISAFDAGSTPATLYQKPNQNGPIVIVAHGFAGSTQIMQAYSLPLAQSGYRVIAFDFEGHGRNPIPMSGDVTSVDGTTALLVAETRRIIATARALPDAGQVALLGHSMATDILVRASIAEARAGTPMDAVVAISMFSQAVTADSPERLLVISGQGEGFLRQAGLDAVHLVDPDAREGDLAIAGSVSRRAVVAPWVEHVGVLFSPTAVTEARAWLDVTFGRQSTGGAGQRGWWILALLAGIVAALQPVVSLLPRASAAPKVSSRRFLLATLVPSAVAPFVIVPLYKNVLPVLVADYLMLHLALWGILQLALLRVWSGLRWTLPILPVGVLVLWGVFLFGLALDRYVASFWPTPHRLPIVVALAFGTIPFMIADSYATQAGRAALWRRVTARIMLFVSLGVAAALDPENLTFVLIVLPVFALFFLVHGVMGRWIGQRSGPLAAGLGLGLCLAWALGVSFPLFVSN